MGFAQALIDRIRLPFVFLADILDEVWILRCVALNDGESFVCAAAILDNDLNAINLLVENALQSSFDEAPLLVGRDDDG